MMLRSDDIPRRAAGFTLIEILVVVSIIGVLAGLSLPIYSSVRASADKTTCLAHLKQITAATNLATNDNNGVYPDMRGYSWEPENPGVTKWIADMLAPYVAGTVNQDPTKLLRCPAAEKNAQESWLKPTMFCHYRYNVYRFDPSSTTVSATGYPLPPPRPLVGYSNAMLFFDTTFNDWTQNQFAHYPGGGAMVNVAYADGHVAALAYNDFKRLDPAGGESNNSFFHLGWTQ